MEWDKLDKYTDKQLMNTLWTPMLDDFTFRCIQEELEKRGYEQQGTRWIKKEV